MEIFPEYGKADLFLAGESYAGTYTAFIAIAILERAKLSFGNPFPALSGIAVASPWIDPRYQYPSYIPFAKQHGLLHGEYLV